MPLRNIFIYDKNFTIFSLERVSNVSNQMIIELIINIKKRSLFSSFKIQKLFVPSNYILPHPRFLDIFPRRSALLEIKYNFNRVLHGCEIFSKQDALSLSLFLSSIFLSFSWNEPRGIQSSRERLIFIINGRHGSLRWMHSKRRRGTSIKFK